MAETWDGYLNDVNGFHVRPEHVATALAAARGGAVAEGERGRRHRDDLRLQGGDRHLLRRVAEEHGGYTVGVLVQANYGRRERLAVDGVPIGREITEAEVPGPKRAGAMPARSSPWWQPTPPPAAAVPAAGDAVPASA